MYNRAIDISLFLIRLVFGGAMIYQHGWPKLMKIFRGDLTKFGDPIGLGPEISLILAVGAEFGCSILLIIGLFTRVATVPLIITMLVAVLIVHGNDPFGDQELGLLYLTAYLALFIAGPGWISIDGRWRNQM